MPYQRQGPGIPGEVLSSLQTTGQSNQILAQHAGSSGKVDAEVIDDAHVQITKRFFFKKM